MDKAIVILSGGQDSTTCLFWALKQFDEVEAITFDYGQRHRIEIEAAKKIAQIAKIKHRIINVNFIKEITTTSDLVSSQQGDLLFEINPENNLPRSFVPGRNIFFISIAAALGYNSGIQNIVTGVCQTDYSGYPDCRRPFIDELEVLLQLAMEKKFKIHTPLMYLTKAQSVVLAQEVGALGALAYSHTCYNGKYPPCRKCPACKIREKGFRDAGIEDPLIERAKNEKLI